MRKICCVLTLIIIQASQVYSQFPQESLTRLPDWANALVIMDYQGILSSPIAQREGWDRVSPMEAIGSSLPCMRNTKYVIQGAKMEAGGLRSQRDIVLLQGGPFPTIEELMKQEKGIEETIANVRGLQTGKNAYLFSFSEKELAVCSPANRQEAARWLRFAQSNKQAVLSPYLVQASEAMKDGYHVVIALDLSDAMDQHLVRRFLQHTPILKSKQVDMDALVRVLTGSRGIRVGIRFDKTIQASLAADFSEEVQGFSSVLPSLVISSLNNLGGELYDFPVDKAQFHGKGFVITTDLSVASLRQVMVLVPTVSGPVLAPRQIAGKGEPVDDAVPRQQNYFRQIRELANSAHQSAEKRNDMLAAARGYEKAAQLIDQLPVAGIDEEIVRFSNVASSKLRAIADALKESVLEAIAVEGGRRTQVEVIPGTYWGYTLGPWNPNNPGDPTAPGGVWIHPRFTPPMLNVITNDSDITAKQQVILAQGVKKRLELWRQLSDQSANLRKQLSLKYKVDF